jgi:hypothetical protein
MKNHRGELPLVQASKVEVISLAADYVTTDNPFVVYATGAGVVKVDGYTGGVGVLVPVAANSVLGGNVPLLVKKVYSTVNGTTATGLVAAR